MMSTQSIILSAILAVPPSVEADYFTPSGVASGPFGETTSDGGESIWWVDGSGNVTESGNLVMVSDANVMGDTIQDGLYLVSDPNYSSLIQLGTLPLGGILLFGFALDPDGGIDSAYNTAEILTTAVNNRPPGNGQYNFVANLGGDAGWFIVGSQPIPGSPPVFVIDEMGRYTGGNSSAPTQAVMQGQLCTAPAYASNNPDGGALQCCQIVCQ